MKSLLKTLALSALATGLLVGCGGQKEEAVAPKAELKPINILAMSSSSVASQVIQSQLTQAGIPSKIIEKKDYGTYLADLENGSFDINITGWTTVTGNPDYAVMSLFHSNGDYNRTGVDDSDLDKALEDGRKAKIGSEDFISSYKNVEKIINENAYVIPTYYGERTLGVTKGLGGTVLSKSRSFTLEDLTWEASSNKSNETDPVYVAHHTINFTSLDPAKANDGSVFSVNTNLYARLVNLSTEDQITSGLATSWYSADQKEFFFAIRPDAKFSNGAPLTGEDIKFSLERASNPELPGNRVYTIQGSIESVDVFKGSDIDSSILSNLETATPDMEIVKITTNAPYGQLYNMLAHTSGGIVSKAVVEGVEDFGNANDISELVVSGPYVMTNIDKQKNEVFFERNEYYYDKAKVKNIVFKVIPDKSGSVLALQSGDVNMVYSIPEDSRDSIASGDKTSLIARSSNAFTYIGFNLGIGGERPTMNADLRKAIYYAVNPDELLTIVLSGNGVVCASPLSPVVAGTDYETGYTRPSFDLTKSKEYLDKYMATLNN